MKKIVKCNIDTASWGKNPIPLRFAALPATWNCDLAAALLYIAIWTRPPKSYGFNISDTWAWLRYMPAISNTPQLRLKKCWKDIDAHQKMLMSDDFGVGCATWWLSQHLGCKIFVETRYFVKQMGTSYYTLHSKNKKGPKKAPDFVGLGPNGLTVLECKGTQTSLKALASLMNGKGGKAQKNSFKTLKGIPPSDSLVIGMFLASFNSKEDSSIVIADPPIRLEGDVRKQDAHLLVRVAFMKIYLAKTLSLLNLPLMARMIFNGNARSVLGVPGSKVFKMCIDQIFPLSIEHVHVWNSGSLEDNFVCKATCNFHLPKQIIADLLHTDDIGNLLAEWSECFSEQPQVSAQGQVTTIELPLGFKMSLKIDIPAG